MSESPPPPHGAAPPPGPYGPYGPVPDHPSATTVLVLGILGLVMCQILSPVAWTMGNRVVREIDASGGRVGGRSAANAGRICGIIGTVLLIASIGFFLLLALVFGALSIAST